MAGGEEVGLRSSSQATSEGRLEIVIEDLHFETLSLPKIEVRHFRSMKKELENEVS